MLNVPTAYLIGLEEKEGVEPFVVAMNDKKVSIYEDDLKRIYDLANSIKGLALDRAQNPYFLLGFASGRADTIRMIIRSATCDGIGGKEKPNDN
ncbi:hypothetical protein FD09_GL002573 [Schleiferilactobacillus perolens DSM 12744]|uniref:Uncharacterized protein n=1 Tax=Schleiferilactobacillus perolens DSM 12744 TaxID=1423792 RepID=A0A0R1MZS9_9LACO|nr:hypothetical protein FD09_GL002573 [Schleiferilactobacillus perolens DSM 12744]